MTHEVTATELIAGRRFGLRAIQYASFKSEETYCFKATLMIDGQPFCTAENDGHGGADFYGPIQSGITGSELHARIDQIEGDLSKVIVETEFGPMQSSIETVVADLMTQWLAENDALKILCRIAYVNERGEIFQLPKMYLPTPANLMKLKKSSWWKPEFRCLNELALSEVVAIIRGETPADQGVRAARDESVGR